jgi:ACS family tartrate transporter-like MFS transporter
LRESRVLALALVAFCIGFGGSGIGLWLPQILQGMGFDNLGTGLVVAAFSILGMAAMVVWGRSSDAKGERIRHVAWPVLLAAMGFLAAALARNDGVALVALAFVVIGFLAADGPFFSLPSSFLGGAAAAGGIAFVNAVGSLGAFLGPVAMGFLKQKTGGYAPGMASLAVALFLGAGIVLALGRTMAPRLAVSAGARRP